MKRLWITGYRSYELNAFKDDDPKAEVIKAVLSENLKQQLDNTDDVFWLITGPQLGVERWATQAALKLKKDYAQLKIAVMMPFADFGSQWSEANQTTLQTLRQSVDFSDNVSDKPYQNPAQLRAYQGFMLTHTDELLLVYDPDHEGKPKWDYLAATKYADRADYPIQLVTMDDLQEAAEEWAEKKREAEAEKRGLDYY